MSDAPAAEEGARGARLWLLLPLLAFLALAALFYIRLGAGDASVVPSALIGKPVPAFTLPPVEGGAIAGVAEGGLTSDMLRSGVTVVNVWASWCGPCREEHPFLMRLAADKRFRTVGINYKDGGGNARAFLAEHGNPFSAVGADARGRAAIDWGVYGVPETFVVKDGVVALKHIGPLTEEALAARVMPAIEAALAGR